MKSALRLVSCFACGLVFHAGVSAEPKPAPSAEQTKAEGLVRALGDPSYKVREQAGHDLLQLGRVAFPALQQGLVDDNPEIRSRCRRLWPIIFEMDLQARLTNFLADTEGKQTHDLPGWSRFRKLVGDDRAARELFAKMLRADGTLLEQAENRPDEFSPDRLVVRALQLQQLANNPRANLKVSAGEGDYALLLFLSANPKVQSTMAAAQQIGTVFYQPLLRQMLLSGDHVEVMRKLVIAWFEVNVEHSATVIHQMSYVATQVGMKELAPLALKVALRKEVAPFTRGTALTVVGRVGNKEQIAAIEPLLADNTVVTNFMVRQGVVGPGGAANNQVRTSQIGDVALAMTIHLSGQKPADFGYDMINTNPNAMFSAHYLGFVDDAARSDARRKWKEWVDKNKGEKK
ncbi:MAG TPA: hypothetical protein VKS79_22040 [Gemmataceae bacterium]|nr:hypothetical protein [Gemmataceae bacterium]